MTDSRPPDTPPGGPRAESDQQLMPMIISHSVLFPERSRESLWRVNEEVESQVYPQSGDSVSRS